jgi:L-threonylcarbamoyladenylate synthase
LIGGPLAGLHSPVFQTSANLSGAPAVSSFEELDPAVLAGVDLAIDGGELRGEPSTVIDLGRLDADGTWRILREGAMPVAAVRSRLGPPADDG